MAVCGYVGALSSVRLRLCNQGSERLLNEGHPILFYQCFFSVKQFRALTAFDHSQHSRDTQGYIFAQIFRLFNRETGRWRVLSGGEHKRFQGDGLGAMRDGVLEEKITFQVFVQGAMKETLIHFHLFLHDRFLNKSWMKTSTALSYLYCENWS